MKTICVQLLDPVSWYRRGRTTTDDDGRRWTTTDDGRRTTTDDGRQRTTTDEFNDCYDVFDSFLHEIRKKS